MTEIQHENPTVQELSSTSGSEVEINDDEQKQDVAPIAQEPNNQNVSKDGANSDEQINDKSKPKTTPRERSATVNSIVEEPTVQPGTTRRASV